MDVYIGYIALYGFEWAPNGWRLADGSLLTIAQNQAVFALLGTAYGGNGTQNFALPDLRGRFPMGQGAGSGLTPRVIGQRSGSESVSITSSQLPSHIHGVTISATTANANSNTPVNGAMLGTINQSNGEQVNLYAPAGGAVINLSSTNTTATGGSQPVSVLNPYLALNFSIAITGIFPSRP